VLGITVVLQILAVVSLLTSVIIVINTTMAIITQQTDQIGVIKALGGTTRDVARLYLVGVLIFGLLALLIALPLGMLAAYFATQQLLLIFNIDYEVFRISPPAIVWQVLAAILAPLLAALWPVMRGAAISVREALATYGLGGDFGFSRFDRASSGWPSASALALTIALGNMFRHQGRLLLTQLVLILAGTMFLMVLTLVVDDPHAGHELDRRQYDLRLFFFQPHRSDPWPTSSSATRRAVGEPCTRSAARYCEEMKDTGGLGRTVRNTGGQRHLPTAHHHRPLVGPR
jgi:putative ABC transport system permease protein